MSPACESFLRSEFREWNFFDEAMKATISADIQVLLKEKYFEGCRGITFTDELKWLITAQAAVLLSGGVSDYFPHLDSILLYPERYVAPVYEEHEGGIVSSGEEVRSGESWEAGTIVLSLDEIRQSGMHDGIYTNLVYHEFAHQIDQELDITGKTEIFLETGNSGGFPWIETFAEAFIRFEKDTARKKTSILDAYGAEHPAEFFAVGTEAFFGIPDRLCREKPAIYKLFEEIYAIDMKKRLHRPVV